ncbi:hypothetical protein SADUNF_Sadunf19G0037100 [Salix dunnii]|uniref:DUF7903 domain-containing protein n=1 Tax=Salix dunnii TaxID=1413687 RepID=A0A835J1U1_9ROSI|nr:hypothetical protein SADUNF_Sadunf19G0037100 [Salix dunnii]
MQAPIHVFKIKYQQSRHKHQQFLSLRLHTFPVNLMAYIPPHMRRSKDVRRASPIPEILQPRFQRNMNLRASTSHKNKCGNIVYADPAISKWFAVGLDDDGQFPPHIHLKSLPLKNVERKNGEKPLVLVNSVVTEEDSKLERTCSTSPWEIIAENIQQELFFSFDMLRNEMDDQGSEKIKPTLVARLGKFLFHGSHSMALESVNKTQVDEDILRQLKRSMYTNIPSSFMEIIVDGVVPVIGVDFEGEKDVYVVKLSDNTRPDATISCKCSVMGNKKLLLYKAGSVELNPVRQMVIDVSCLDRNLDLRVMLCTKKILTTLTEDEKNSISDLINSAVLDSDMKGGLRWPLGKASSGGRYSIIGAWHTVTKAYKSSSFRLKVRDADRFDFKSGDGEAAREIYLKLKRIVSEIQASSFIGLQTFPVNLMAYIPPHMRRSEDVRKASPIPETLQPQFQRKINLRASTSHKNKCGKIVYADHAISKWFAVGLDDDGQFPPNIHLEPTSLKHVELESGEKTLVLVNSVVSEEDGKLERNCYKSPWEIIAENVHQELVSSFEILRKEMDDQGSEKVKPALVARLGKIHFRGSHSVGLESVNKIQVEEAILRKLRRSFYTDIPSSHVENIIDGIVPLIGVDFEGEKDVFLVKLSDTTRPDATIACKCRVMENKKLLFYKAGFVELNPVRQMVIDVSCLDKNLDLRVALCTKKILTTLTDEEKSSISDLINSAVLDSHMKGGIRWPLGASSGGRYSVIGTWHTVTKIYKSSSFRLKVRDADRFDFKSGSGEAAREIVLKLNRIVSEIQASSFIWFYFSLCIFRKDILSDFLLLELGAESDSISKMLEDNLRLIWDEFLL